VLYTGASPLLLHLFYDAANCVNLGQLAGALMGGYSSTVQCTQGPRLYYYIYIFYDAASCVNLGQLAGALMGDYSGAVQGPHLYYNIDSMMQLPV
jgi:hypothetical protein